HPQALPRAAAARANQGSRQQQVYRAVNQQLRLTRLEHHNALSMPMADRAVLQVDQTTPSHQGFLRHLGERGQDADLDSRIDLRARCHRQEALQAPGIPVRTSTDSELDAVRARPNRSDTYA